MDDKKKTLSEKISELINPNPVWEDPETEYSETTAKVVDNSAEYLDDEILPRSSLKLSQCALLDEDDEKYLGKKVSRKNFENGSSILGDLSKEIEESEISEDENTGALDSELSSDDAVSEDEEIESECNAIGSDATSLVEQDAKTSDNNQVYDGLFKNLITNDLSAQLEKGNAVRSQIRLWDNLLEVRIQLQKCLVAANRLPQHDSFHSFKKLGESDFQTQLNLCKKGGLGLLEKLMEFQGKMLQSYPETKELCSRKSINADADDEIISSDEEGDESSNLNVEDEIPTKRRKLNEYSEVLTQQHNDYKNFRNNTLEKWYNRAKVSVGVIKSSNFSAFDMSVLKQIDHLLSDKKNLIKRTQKKRSSYRVLGNPDITETKKVNEAKNEEEFDKEIYDDDDFYHKLLRELIERKAADVSDPVELGRQWTELQKLRRKLKKKVDTKASKGRKIRYVVHSKLVNFMAPIPNNWSDSAMDDLFRSLFGKTE